MKFDVTYDAELTNVPANATTPFVLAVNAPKAPARGALIALSVQSNADVTAGTITCNLKSGSTVIGTAVLDTTNTTRKVSLYADEGRVVTPSDVLSIDAVASSGLLPNGSADLTAKAVVRYIGK